MITTHLVLFSFFNGASAAGAATKSVGATLPKSKPARRRWQLPNGMYFFGTQAEAFALIDRLRAQQAAAKVEPEPKHAEPQRPKPRLVQPTEPKRELETVTPAPEFDRVLGLLNSPAYRDALKRQEELLALHEENEALILLMAS